MSAHADSNRSVATIDRQHDRKAGRVDKAQQQRLANHNREQGC